MKSPDKAAFETILILAVTLAIILLPVAAKAESEHKHSPPRFQSSTMTVTDSSAKMNSIQPAQPAWLPWPKPAGR